MEARSARRGGGGEKQKRTTLKRMFHTHTTCEFRFAASFPFPSLSSHFAAQGATRQVRAYQRERQAITTDHESGNEERVPELVQDLRERRQAAKGHASEKERERERERERENVRPTAPLSCLGTQVDDHRSLFCLVVQALAHVVPGCAADLAQGLVGHGGRRLERSGGVEELRLRRAPSHHLGLSIHTSPGRGAEDGIKFSLRLEGGVGGSRPSWRAEEFGRKNSLT